MQNENNKKKFGNRTLNDKDKVFEQNAWDNVDWNEEQMKLAIEKINENTSIKLNDLDAINFDAKANQYWNSFYEIHNNKFFKDRHWLFTEFPELLSNYKIGFQNVEFERDMNSFKNLDDNLFYLKNNNNNNLVENDNKSLKIFELGCGVGNTVLSILEINKNPLTFAYCCDFSSKAIDILKSNPSYEQARCDAFVFDCTMDEENYKLPFEEQSIDIIIMIFTLSAINPDKMQSTINNACKYLKKGGCFLFRDYGRYDLAQLRFKKGKCISDNFYVRGDGTRVYFFAEEEIDELFTKAGLQKKWLYVDRRLQVNRGKQLKMYRIWIQSKFVKI